jgi:chromosome segregation protein
VHLKSLTLKGFKSFASATTLCFEPGITTVVGPNGSGKSNVVDALAWVMGEQGAKSLRGGKMEDVIFAGTAGRPPLGRAEVSLTIDNSDGALPIDYAEVTLSRIMFRSGGSEYSINRTPCRLLDIQDLLSDSGIGREMHVIVGQGQLDAVLSASPEERRGFIEEAAGILKHRKRKEKALRKLEAMQANLARLQDLTVELRRQLGPLGRQAQVARRAAAIQADVRDARLRLLADDLGRLTATVERDLADEAALRARREEVESGLAAAHAREAELDDIVRAEAPRRALAQETWYGLGSLQERLRGTAGLAAERARLFAEEAQDEGSGPHRLVAEELAREAADVRALERELVLQVERDRTVLADAVEHRTSAEAELSAEERRVAAAAQAAADRREGLARLAGQAAARRSRVEAGEAEVGRLRGALTEARARADRAQDDFTALETQVAGLDEGEEGLDAEHDRAASELAGVERRLGGLREEERSAERDRASFAARREALELGLARRDGAGALLGAGQVDGLLGPLATLLRVETGAETALAAALGAGADALAVASLDDAVAAIGRLRAEDAGRAGFLIGSADADVSASVNGGVGGERRSPGTYDRSASDRPQLPAGARWALDMVTAPARLAPALAHLLDGVVVVGDLEEARTLVGREPSVSAVTLDGDVVGLRFAAGGSSSAPSRLEVQTALDEAVERHGQAAGRAERVRFALTSAAEEQQRAAARVETALARLHESDARLAAVAEQLGQLGSAARGAAAEAERLARTIGAAQESLAQERRQLGELDQRLAAAQETPDEHDAGGDDRPGLAAACTAARAAELEARLAVRTGEERVRACGGRAEGLERAVRQEREARERAAARREQRRQAATVAAAVARSAEHVLARLHTSLSEAAAERTAAESAVAGREGELQALRLRIRELTAELERLTDSVHRDEVARAQQQLRIEQLQTRAVEELGIDPGTLVEDYGPHQPVPLSSHTELRESEPRDTEPYVREQQEKRLRRAERDLGALGRVNPLALEEYAALEERQHFLAEQLRDLEATRRDLLDIIREVDERVEQVFASAFADTAREFEAVFARLFPGGEGRLLLGDPGSMLTSGIEVEARPPGKKIKRLSLLSSGERSLTAVALLLAIFKARPSPFYVLDEVEAALDDTNLSRLLVLLEELRESSQLIVITHQKRTMEIADALYGVSMRGDGITGVISQRLREPESA